MKKRTTILLFQGFCAGIALIVVGLSTSGCADGCPYISQQYITMTNTLSAPVTVTFRRYWSEAEFIETIAAGETRTIELGNYKLTHPRKAGVIKVLCDDDVVRESFPVEYSNATLAQYMVCYYSGVRIMALTDTCPIGYSVTSGY